MDTLDQEKSRTKWSRAEKQIITGLILIVISLALPFWLGVQTLRYKSMAQQDVADLVAAAERFRVEYGYWPSPDMGTPNDVRYGDEKGNEMVLNILRAIDGPGNEAHQHNPNQVRYIVLGRKGWRRSGINDVGAFVDPWGTPYQIVLDTDLNEIVTLADSIYPNLLGEGVAVWSLGPDRRSDTGTDIVSWEH
jgi:hypothetical protein